MLEQSKNYLIEAQIDYWKEMILLNKERVSCQALREMHQHLVQARLEWMELTGGSLKLVA